MMYDVGFLGLMLGDVESGGPTQDVGWLNVEFLGMMLGG